MGRVFNPNVKQHSFRYENNMMPVFIVRDDTLCFIASLLARTLPMIN